MASGSDWRRSWGYLVNSDNDDEETVVSRRTSTTTEPSSYTYDERSSDEESAFSSVAGEEILMYDDEVYRNISRMLHKGLRRSRPPKKQKDRDIFLAKQNKITQKQNIARRRSKDHSVAGDDELYISDNQEILNDDGKKSDHQRRKRPIERLRTSERDAKWEVPGMRLDSPDGQIGLPLLPIQASVKVEQPNHFKSLNSKPVIPKELLDCDGSKTPPKMQQLDECPQDRQEFWVLFSLLVRMGNPDRKNKEGDCNFARQVRAPPDPLPPPIVRSQEEHVWQNKLNDLVWLSLRAWHSGRSIRDEDQVLCTERESIKAVLDEVMNFTFRPSTAYYREKGCPFVLPVETVANAANTNVTEVIRAANEGENPLNETSGKPRRPRLEIPLPGGTFDETSDWNPGYSCCGLCSIFCQSCLENQNNALAQVKDLLERIDEVERLYPSSRAMRKDWDLYKSPEFTGRVKSLCLFYNLVTDLRHKIATLGKMQASIGTKNFPWPTFVPIHHGLVDTEDVTSTSCNPSSSSSSSVDGATVDVGCDGPSTMNVEKRERKSSKCVRFHASACLNLKVDSNGSVSGGSTSDSGYGPPSLTPTSLSPANEAASPACSPGPESGAWSWSAAASVTPSQSACSTPVSSKYSGFVSPTYSRSVSEQSSEGTLITPYRRYVDKLLKTKGLRKIFMALMDLIRTTLMKSRGALELHPKQPIVSSPDLPKLSAEDAPPLTVYNPPPLPQSSCSAESMEELRQYGLWGDTFQQMSLPSFRNLYLFLSQIPLDVMHECLQLRLEQQPKGPSSLSVRQLMRECKEAIKAAVVIRQKFLRMTRTVMFKAEVDKMEQDMVEFDSKVERMFQSYLSYFQSWVQMLLKSSTQQTQKNVLEDEWTFVKVFSRYIQRGEALACETFCSLACSMFESTGDNLDSDLDKCTSLLYDSISSDQDTSSSRQSIWQCCREYKDAFQEARKRAIKAISFAKMLRKDLEIAAEFRIEGCVGKLFEKLRETGHVRLIAPHSSNIIIFIPDHVKENRLYLWQLLSMTYGHEQSAAPDNADSEGYLVILRCEDCGLIPGRWPGPTIEIEPTAEITITLSCLNVEGLLLVVNHSSQLSAQRKVFQEAMGSLVTLTKEFTSCNQYIAESLSDLKREGITLQCKITKAIQDVEDRLSMDSVSDMEETDQANLLSRFREVLNHCYKFGFEYQKEVTRLVTGESRSELGYGLIGFANQWMRFVLERCERGRGVRPRWANQGLDFLMTACEPQYLKTVSDEDFQNLKATMNNCIAHLIGSANNKSTASPGGIGSRSQSPTPHSRLNFRQSASYNEQSSSRLLRSSSTLSVKSEPTSSSNLLSPWSVEEVKQPHVDVDEDVDDELPMVRIRRAIDELEGDREAKLRKNNMIGNIRDVLVETTIHINARRVTFRWQRGNKIGQGRFGKVYTAVNTDTGELMALKEIHLQPNDHKTIKEVADELRIFEGIKHLRLVRYYGVEIHREEMFIFMEYCDYGTLEHAAQLGLPEPQVRKYTRQLLEAVCVLHEHGIVHRDIKGANVFLTTNGNLKLGDFGCCIKLKNHTTMPGELNSFVGTQAFMAPEVFTKTVTEGHGRAADIWSVGCVVLEMTTGHRPWHELENNYQIMFKVGMGETPEIPYTLSQEGQDFLSHCFKFDPRERWTAISLLDHPFTKVDSDDDLQSMTFLPDAHLLLQKLACP